MKSRLFRAALGAALIYGLYAGAVWLSQALEEHRNASRPLAFQNARWGMSAREVELADRVVLKASSFAMKSRGRHEVFERPGTFLGRPATFFYLFGRHGLSSYYVFVSGRDAPALEEEVSAYLEDAFGPQHIQAASGSPALKKIWNLKDAIINYWFYEEPASLASRHVAAFGVLYRPYA